ncbi:hypothetical protein K0M31_005873 [Melipona bicolor]|uniref:Uncharacterized protein n=1 Tax=Melipona bicolor TaxID=60889 RepID=A0AA40FV21_9HYME|nr:hypothetical protein K0M31_005873 [Melipona bicolor]
MFQLEQLYIEVLYTVANTVGASTGQYAHYKEDLYRYAQEAFGVPQDQHRRYLNIASEEKPPIVVLSVVVVEAEGLEAKDANGEDFVSRLIMRHAVRNTRASLTKGLLKRE